MNIDDLKDQSSKLLSRSLDVLFIEDEVRTSLGIIIGVVFQGIILATEPAWKKSNLFNFSNLDTLHYLSFGIFILFLPNIIRLLRGESKETTLLKQAGENVIAALDAIDEAKKRGAPKSVTTQMYRNLQQQVLKNTHLNEKTQQELKELEKTTD